ncbi:MAG: carbohydrate-binding family V/XII [Deltaproteobacteria bacterium]|nr:carbohydrate-binding family V/XII [Deltaproteobacteria bacterium]
MRLNQLKFGIVLLFCLLLLSGVFVQAQNDVGSWPQEIETPTALIVIYQPQPESLDGNLLKGRAAVSVESKNGNEPLFGAIWFTARLDSDHEERLATLSDLKISEVRMPFAKEEQLTRFRREVEAEVPKWVLPISLDRLLASLETVATRSAMAEKLKNEPPQIIFMPEPAILVTIDGEPRLVAEEKSSLLRVVNTPFTILLVPEEKTYYLNADQKTWYKASEIKGEWRVADKVPAAVALRAPQPEPVEEGQESSAPDDKTELGPAPKIVVATEPTELISCTGKPEYTPIQGTGLLYLSNSDSDLFLAIESQDYYILLAGRWFSSRSLNGPWHYVAGTELPADFAAIPEDSEMATVLYAVPGTEAAREAVLEAEIPQTAKVERKKTTLVVEYDGEPRFATITGTRMIYAVNTATPVIYVKRRYYACDEAVWFVSATPLGPWQVADAVPSEIYTIPPDNPLYNVTFVKIYSSTPDEVYVGYTPGYTHTYIYHDTVVYGTGYDYPGWYQNWYCPRPLTYGFDVRYSSWGGWSFGFSYAWSPFTFYFGQGWYRGGWWGPYRYHSYHELFRPNLYRGAYALRKPGYRSGFRLDYRRPRPGFYNGQKNRNRSVRPSVSPARVQARPASRRDNNLFTDRQGNVYRKSSDKWERRTRDGWQPESSAKRQAVPVSRPVKRSPERVDERRPEPNSVKRSEKQPLKEQRYSPPSQPQAQPQPQQSQSQRRQESRSESESRANTSGQRTTNDLDSSYHSRERGSRQSSDFQRSRQGGDFQRSRQGSGRDRGNGWGR